jgi:hypothetical protein
MASWLASSRDGGRGPDFTQMEQQARSSSLPGSPRVARRSHSSRRSGAARRRRSCVGAAGADGSCDLDPGDQTYQRILKLRGAPAEVRDEFCLGCSTKVTPQNFMEVMRNDRSTTARTVSGSSTTSSRDICPCGGWSPGPVHDPRASSRRSPPADAGEVLALRPGARTAPGMVRAGRVRRGGRRGDGFAGGAGCAPFGRASGPPRSPPPSTAARATREAGVGSISGSRRAPL